MKASVVIVTKNRKIELRRAVASALRQQPTPEIIVIDDGSTDGTETLMRDEFPQVALKRHEDSRGYIQRRNEGAALASGDVLFSIDDDAEFADPSVVEQTLSEFNHARIGAVAIPFSEPKKQNQLRQIAPDDRGVWVTDTFIGTAHALLKKVFFALGGYRVCFVHQGEERDYCLRMLDQGYVVKLGNAGRIVHHESPRRDFARVDLYGRRNDILFAWHNAPMPFLAIQLLGSSINGLLHGLREQRCWAMLHGLAVGYVAAARQIGERRPVSPAIFRLHRVLKKRGSVCLQEIEPMLPDFNPFREVSANNSQFPLFHGNEANS